MPRFLKSLTLLLLVPVLLGLALACGGNGGGGGSAAPTLAISSFSPTSGRVGDVVAISGNGFSGSTAVAFGGVPATTYSVDNGTQISAFVPSGAVTGPITVSVPSGTLTSFGSFTVLPALPVISDFSSNPAAIGASVTINGQHLSGTTSVTLGGVAVGFTVISDTQIQITVPTAAWIGNNVVVVVTPGGTATSNPGLSVIYPTLAITGFSPTGGPVGTPVTITGEGFTGASSISFNGTTPLIWTVVDSTQITATVPTGASTGLIRVTNGTTADSTVQFLITSLPIPDLTIEGAYISQSTQTFSGSVPLVQDRDGFLRVFLMANLANTAAPSIRVRIIDGVTNSLLYTYSITNALVSSVPTAISEGTLTDSWNKTLPGALIRSGYYLTLEVDPSNTVAKTGKTNNLLRYPTAGNLDVRTAKVFYANIVPVVQNSLTGNVDSSRTLASWVDRFQRMYPVQNMPGGVDVIKGSAYTFSGALLADGTGWNALLGDIDAKRTTEGSLRYYYGAVNVSYASGVAGLGYVGHPVAIGWDKTGYGDGGNYPEVYAHEVGRNLGRLHAPCVYGGGTISDVDPSWPPDSAYANASIGVYGYDVANSALKSPSTYKDIMSYCTPLWVSDYMYKGIMDYRAASPIGDVTGATVVPQECLLVWGSVKNGEVILEPAFKVITTPQLPEPGSHTLQLQDAQGNTLLETSFEPVEIADLPGEVVKRFAFAIPLDSGIQSSLSGLRVMEKGVLRSVRSSSGTAAKMVGVREPVFMRMRAGEAHLSWDPMAHPKVMVRDPRTGDVISIADGGSLDVVTDATELDVTFSDGVNSTRKILKVQ